MEDNSFLASVLPATQQQFEDLRKVVKGLIETNQGQMKMIQGLQKQIDLLGEAIKLLRPK